MLYGLYLSIMASFFTATDARKLPSPWTICGKLQNPRHKDGAMAAPCEYLWQKQKELAHNFLL